MHIVSWNVAGLSTTLQKIDTDFGVSSLSQLLLSIPNEHPDTAAASAKRAAKPPRCHAFSYYIKRHEIDILCIQEHKIPHKQLSSRSEPMGCTSVPGYESFWSCCTDKNSKGMNGVVTYAKVGTVLSADSTPLGDEELDLQGRCIKTDHGSFVIFNVYVPQGGSCGINFKLRFLQKLRLVIQECRIKCKKPVILVGDLNIARQPIDVFWNRRQISIGKVLNDVRRSHSGDNTPPIAVEKWKLDVAKSWADITAALDTKRAIEKQTTNPTTGEKFDKFCVAVTSNKREIILGKAEATKEDALLRYDLSPSLYFNGEKNEDQLWKDSNVICLDVLTELMLKVCGVELSASTQRHIASCSSSNCLYHESPTIDWFRKIIDEDQMVDAFRLYYPKTEGRFTCWHQYLNRRFVNEGSRIDYTLVDKQLEPYIQQGAALRGEATGHDPDSEAAVLNAVTACGGYKAASFDGSGIGEANQKAIDSQFGPLHTGMIYTPPSYSDHIAISLLLDNALMPQPLPLEETERSTRRAQPYKSQSSIKSFFSADRNRIKASISKEYACASSAESLPEKKIVNSAEKKSLAKVDKDLKRKAVPNAPNQPRDDRTHRSGKNSLQRWFQPNNDLPK